MATSTNTLTDWGHREVKHVMALAGIADAKVLSQLTGIPHGTLRNWIAGSDPMRRDRVYTVVRHLLERAKRDSGDDQVRTFTEAILGTNDGVPDEPPKQPKGPSAPPKRREGERTTGPKRATGAAA